MELEEIRGRSTRSNFNQLRSARKKNKNKKKASGEEKQLQLIDVAKQEME